ncbi:MAG: helix-turn-helix transcriptional regulator [Nocardiopsis sp. BM-2018]|nr:MAG: helix-turn-helix transcriptional regulator [Nocardiopsis sp. BM-2018]
MSTSDRVTIAGLRASERFSRPEVQEAYEQTRLRFELGEAVRLRREELGWSQAELGRRCGMPQSSIARFEHGGTQPTLTTLERLADALGLVLNVRLEFPNAA